MSAPDEILSDLLDAINDAGQLDGFSVWCEVAPVLHEAGARRGCATAKLEVALPDGGVEVAHLIAHPMQPGQGHEVNR
ncbi:hypothetical protein P3H15_27435 [Rhodococcus sp. T2V]|uniref:hypothetical protein n=1 Tax=Rhodococcus sp. T2V TaxID=3034164 RepID=UPI0023E2E68D|nr:hypothetical protein [Rhodococcus sp. T2V]MDF3308756.1 hypothetical protein [Rhodococcus sp. T2V]